VPATQDAPDVAVAAVDVAVVPVAAVDVAAVVPGGVSHARSSR